NGIWRALHIARIVLFSGRHLLRRQALLSHNRGPGCCSVPAARKLLVDLLVTGTAISCGHVRGDYNTVVFLLFLALLRLVTVEARNALCCVFAHFVFVDNRVLLPRMAFGAFTAGPNERSVWLVKLGSRACTLDHKSAHNQREGNHDSDKDVAKRHCCTCWEGRRNTTARAEEVSRVNTILQRKAWSLSQGELGSCL